MRINNTGADFAVGAQNGVGEPRQAPTAGGTAGSADADEVVLSVESSEVGSASLSATQAIVNSGGYETDSLLTAGRIVDSALVKID